MFGFARASKIDPSSPVRSLLRIVNSTPSPDATKCDEMRHLHRMRFFARHLATPGANQTHRVKTVATKSDNRAPSSILHPLPSPSPKCAKFPNEPNQTVPNPPRPPTLPLSAQAPIDTTPPAHRLNPFRVTDNAHVRPITHRKRP